MKTRIKQFGNIETGEYEKWFIEIKSEVDNKYHMLYNRSVPHIFETYDEAKIYLDSVKTDLEELVRTEPRERAKVSA